MEHVGYMEDTVVEQSNRKVLGNRQEIDLYFPENGLVVYPFNGSGTTGIATVEAGRNFIGFENNKKYYNQSLERNSQHFTVQVKPDSYSVTPN